MANTTSAKKAIRVSERRSVINLRLKRALKSSVKDVKKAILKGEKDNFDSLLKQAYKSIDKAAKKDLIHKNTAARYKSNIAKAVNKVA